MRANRDTVVTVGGATAERVIVIPNNEYREGRKHTLGPTGLMAGGSAINNASRLLAAGLAQLRRVFRLQP